MQEREPDYDVQQEQVQSREEHTHLGRRRSMSGSCRKWRRRRRCRFDTDC
jgi:hypothetical protein